MLREGINLTKPSIQNVNNSTVSLPQTHNELSLSYISKYLFLSACYWTLKVLSNDKLYVLQLKETDTSE